MALQQQSALRNLLSVLWVVFLALPASCVQAETADSWVFQRTADPMAGGSISIASFSGGDVDALVRCWGATNELDLRFLLAPGSGRATSDKIKLGFDERKDATRTWRVSPNGLALVVPGAQRAALLRRLQNANAMRLEVTTGSSAAGDAGISSQFEIPLRGSGKAIRSVLQACNRSRRSQ